MNDVAYALADASQDLPLAEKTERQVLDKLASETQTWTLDEAPALLRSKSALLTASWDTMGWILYREGKVNDAEPYIEASWLYNPSLEVGQHLGDVEVALGHKDTALRSYQLTLAGAPRVNAMGVRTTETTPQMDELNRRITHLGGNGSGKDSNAALQALRS